MQRLAYNIVNTHFNSISSNREPLRLIIVDVAGTGKSYLINALRNLLQGKCAVTATTGKASYNIRGITIHSLVKLPIGSQGKKELAGQSLCRLQNSLNGVDYILIDEYSMLGQVTFGWMDKRCKQATGFHDKVLGGKSLILIGDPGQLPPVADKPLYHAKPSNAVGEQGYQTYRMFDKVVKLTVNQRVQGMSSEQVTFRDLLLRLRKGESTVDDWKLLLTRQPSSIPDLSEFEDATRLFYSNEQVANYNHDQLRKLEHPVAHINARHSSAAAKKIPSEDMSGLEPVVFLAKGARVMLTMNLWSSVGLCNGATGTVIDFIFESNHHPPDLPVAVIVQFENYRGPSFDDTKPSCVPICPITVSSQSENGFHERQQLPLRLAWALTIHKSQGLTLSKAWIDIGKSERSAGVSYVAISRVKTLSSCVIEPMSYERFTSLKSSANLQFRLEEENRLDSLAQSTIHTVRLAH
jgi:ATP-dependent exoDNAse (exonuclease V) alpha subunit